VWVNSQDENDKKCFYQTMNTVLRHLTIIISPIMPFITEIIYTNLTKEDSVHLSSWPKTTGLPAIENALFSDMDLVRAIVEVGQRVRKEIKIKVRQPLSSITVKLPKKQVFQLKKYQEGYIKLIKDELNIKNVVIIDSESENIETVYDTNLTTELVVEGKVRELIRDIQSRRKQLGKKPNEEIALIIPELFLNHKEYIMKKVLARKIEIGSELQIIL